MKKLRLFIKHFVHLMENKLLQKFRQGYSGWDDPQKVPDYKLVIRLKENMQVEDWVDVACLAMILHFRKVKSL